MLNLHFLFPDLYLTAAILGRLVASSVILTQFDKHDPSHQKHRAAWSLRLNRTLSLSLLLSLPLFIETMVWLSSETVWSSELVWYGTLRASFSTQTVKVALVMRTALRLLATEEITSAQGIRAPEYTMLMGFATLGLVFLACANDLITLYIALEWQSLVLYVLASFRRASAYSTEAGLKYFIQGSVMSAVYLLGAALVYQAMGTVNFTELASLQISQARLSSFDTISAAYSPSALTSMDISNLFWSSPDLASTLSTTLFGLVLIASALLFKMAAVPFHAWAPDVYEGSPMTSSIYFASVPKIAQIALFVRIFSTFEESIYFWQLGLLLVSLASMTLAPFSARAQMKWKRFLAYSSIANVGNMLLALAVGGFAGVQAIWFYGLIYGLSVLRVWLSLASVTKIEVINGQYQSRPIKYIHELGALVKHNTALAYTVAAGILGSAGLPPFVMFQAKLSVVLAAVVEHYSLLAVYMVLISVLTTFYYLRFVKILFFTVDDSDAVVKESRTAPMAMILSVLSILMVLLMVDMNLASGIVTWMTLSSGMLE